MKTVAFVVSRMGSTRVPGKALIEVAGQPVLWHVLEAAKKINGVDQVVLATTDLKSDEPLLEVAKKSNVKVFRGDPERVLDRLYHAAREFRADIFIDIGGDCPLIDPHLLSDALNYFRQNDFDYLCNYEPPTFPEGYDINILKFSALEKAFNEAIAPSQRIHPFSYLSRHPDLFKIGNIENPEDLSTLHWSLDFPEDIDFIKAVFALLYEPGKSFSMKAILDLIEDDDQVRGLNNSLIKPKSSHAFWNSPGIIRDMHEDIRFLVSLGQEELRKENFKSAYHAYSECSQVIDELKRLSKFRQESK